MRTVVSSSPPSTRVTALGMIAAAAVTVLCLCLRGAGGAPVLAEETAKSTKPPTPIPEIPKDKLPAATGEKPNPRKEQYLRGTVFVSVEEFVELETGEAYEPKVPLLQVYLAEYFRRAGFEVTEDRADAKFSIVGFFEAAYVRTLTFKNQRFALQFEGSAGVEVTDATGRLLGKIEAPRQIREAALMAKLPKSTAKNDGASPPPPEGDANKEKSGSKEADAKKGAPKSSVPKKGDGSKNAAPLMRAQAAELISDFRREHAKIIWQKVFQKLTPIADAEIPPLIDSLSVDDFEAAEPVDGDAVVAKLVARRFDAVPYLLDALSDERPVLVEANYPRLTPLNAEKLRVFHLADKALENIFQKVSRLNLDSPDEHRFIIIKAWENEWRRFCKPYKDSPSAPPRKKGP